MLSEGTESQVAQATLELALCDGATSQRVKVLEVLAHSPSVHQDVVANPYHQLVKIGLAETDCFLFLLCCWCGWAAYSWATYSLRVLSVIDKF